MVGGYNWTWPQIPSLTAMKYQRHGYVQVRTKVANRLPFAMVRLMKKLGFVNEIDTIWMDVV